MFEKLTTMAILAGAIVLPARADNYSVPIVRLPMMQTAPTIDGVVHDDEWRDADRMERFGRPAPLSPQQASFWIGGDQTNLYIAVVSETPPGGKLLARANPMPNGANARPFLDDSVELVLDPLCHLGTDSNGRRKLYHLIVNARGATWQQCYSLSGGGVAWHGHWHIGSQIIGDRWNLELSIPWTDFDVTPADLSYPMGMRIGRNWMQAPEPHQTEWSPLGTPYTTPESMPVLTFDPAAPVVQVLQLQDPGGKSAHFKVSVRNPGAAALHLAAQIDVVPKNSAPTHHAETLDLAPGASQTVDVSASSSTGEDLYTNIQVASTDGATIYYRRNFQWQTGRPATVWVLDASATKKVDTSFAYYPYSNKMQVVVNLAGLKSRDGLRGVSLALRRVGGRSLATTAMPPLQGDSTQIIWDVPALDEGEYELVVGLDGLSVPPQVLPFARHKFAWEGNKLGTSDIVVPPFTPIQVEGNQVQTVLRRYTQNGLGLWDQVVALGQPLLKGPMRLEATIDGHTVQAHGNLRFTQSKATRAVAQAQWSAANLNGSTRSEWDYDGVMKSTIDLEPSAHTIDALTLVIPLDDSQMPLMHACTDGLRFNYSGYTPAGIGRIWDGSKAARNSIVGTYVPYIWVGGQERGLAVFGENDAGWVDSPNVPCQELVRTAGGTLELRLHLIAAPTTITAARHIVIGFQATPIKPMPANWRLWTVGAKGQTHAPGSLFQAFLGSCYYWGALTPCLDVYPRDEDFSIWDKLAQTRKTGIVDKAFVEQWLTGYNEPEEQIKSIYRPSVQYAFHAMTGKPDGVLVYTNGRGVRFDTPEGQTFLNEWDRNTFPTRQWARGDGVAYDLDPSPSFRDYALWYYKKMYDTFDDAIYWDDIFLQSNFNTLDSAAYMLPDGSTQPAAGLWNMRDLIRRTATLGQEMGKPNGNMVHMTNTAIAPILAFARTDADWEDRSGDTDFQDRFSRDFIQTESIGRQFGNVPIVLTLIRGTDEAKLKWARRTAAGVMLTHEVKPWGSVGDYWADYDRLVEFGYGNDATKVWNYWQHDYPARIAGGDSSSLLLSKPGAVMLVVCDYGHGGDYRVKLDTKALNLRLALVATDAETHQPVQVNDAGEIVFSLKQHDFKMIEVTTP